MGLIAMKAVVLVTVFLGLAFLTHRRTQDWRDAISLWGSAVRETPCLVRPHVQLAMAYTSRGDNDLAVREWQAVAGIHLHEAPCGP